ncbi:MAG: flippase-like domain-containing protein [Bacteroidales bacterium]|nr:flippase-like domain-containing protein [Bacteroidales bacterium]
MVLQLAFSLLLGAFFIWFFVRRLAQEEIDQIWDVFGRANYGWITISLIVAVLSHWFRAIRWILLLQPMGYKPKYINTFGAVMIGYLGNLVFPRLGEILRCSSLYQQEKVPVSKSLGTVVTERAIDFIIYAALFVFVIITFGENIYSYIEITFLAPILEKVSFWKLAVLLFGITVALLGIYFLFRRKLIQYGVVRKIENFAISLWDGLKSIVYLKRPWIFLVQTFMIWFCYYLGLYVCFFALPETSSLGWEPAMVAFVLSTVGSMLVQGGMGIYPMLIAGSLAIYGIADVKGYALGWLIWGAQQIVVVVLGTLFIILLPYFNRKKR